MIKNAFNHFKTILTHKYWVFVYSCKLGIPWQGLIHDMSKFSPTEFSESVKYYMGTSSPIPQAKLKQGFSLAWQHHKGRNPHHYEYWTDNYDNGTTTIQMPYKYVLELVADYLAAGRTYRGKYFAFRDEWDWWVMRIANNPPKMHPKSRELATHLFRILYTYEDKGQDGFKYIRINRKMFENEYNGGTE